MGEHKDVLAFAGATAILVGGIWRDEYHSMVAEKDAEIDRLKEEINRLRQYEDAVTSATDGSLLVWNLMSTNHTVIKNDYWQSHLEEIDRLKAELEQTRVQLAGCGVAALCNTRESMAMQIVGHDAYGYSASYQDVLDAVGREINLREMNEALERQLAEVTAKYNDVCTIERVDLLKQQLAEARAENERLKDKLSDAYDDHCDSH